MKKLISCLFLAVMLLTPISNVSAGHIIKYKIVRFQHGGSGTNCWYAKIPANIKMHFSYSNDRVMGGVETPSSVAKRHKATLAVNSQFLGMPIINGQKLKQGANVAGYDFYVKKNNHPKGDYDVLNVFAVRPGDPKAGISFQNINIGFRYDGNDVCCNDSSSCKGCKLSGYGVTWMALFNQVVMNHKITTSPNNNLTQRHPRTWIAYDSKGTQYVTVCSGRNKSRGDMPSTQLGLTYVDMVNFTKKYLTTDIQTLYNLDGGGSSSFVYEGKLISPYIYGSHAERPVFGTFWWDEKEKHVDLKEIVKVAKKEKKALKESKYIGSTSGDCSLIESIIGTLKILLFSLSIVGIIMMIILTSLDFVKAITSSDENALSEAFRRMFKRILLVVILLLVPMLITWLLNLADIKTCTIITI